METSTISAIYIYPVKSCRGIALTSANLDRWGLECDRNWMLVDDSGKFITQRQLHRMSLIATALALDCLILNAPGMSELHLPILPFSDRPATKIEVVVWRDRVLADDCGQQASEWFSKFLGVSCRLVRMNQEFNRPTDPTYTPPYLPGQVTFADGFPLLIISEASLADLNSRLANPVPMNRFRPNLVVKDCAAFAEDTWQKLKIGEVLFYGVKPCSRCVITTVDQATGSSGKEPLLTLATYRSNRGGIFFGQNLIHAHQGTIKLGDVIALST
jgi:uncharacterized protein